MWVRGRHMGYRSPVRELTELMADVHVTLQVADDARGNSRGQSHTSTPKTFSLVSLCKIRHLTCFPHVYLNNISDNSPSSCCPAPCSLSFTSHKGGFLVWALNISKNYLWQPFDVFSNSYVSCCRKKKLVQQQWILMRSALIRFTSSQRILLV